MPNMSKYAVRVVLRTPANRPSVWIAEHPELNGCTATGQTREEAITNLGTSREAWLAVAKELAMDIPPEPAFSAIYEARPCVFTATAVLPGFSDVRAITADLQPI